jgi:hypothetical protein
MRVEVDLFSGRPNPAWVLEADEAREIAAVLAALAPAAEAPAAHEGLGYRGVVLTGIESDLAGCDELRLARGAAVAQCFGRARAYADPARALETRLIETGRIRLPPELFDTVRTWAGV